MTSGQLIGILEPEFSGSSGSILWPSIVAYLRSHVRRSVGKLSYCLAYEYQIENRSKYNGKIQYYSCTI